MLIIVSVSARAQYHSHKNFNDYNGLPSAEVYQIIQDDNKFIWFATDNGVVRYNGSQFQTFDRKKGLPDPVVFGFHKDLRGRLWFRTFSGALSYFENDSIFLFPHNDSVKRFVKKSILSDIAIDTMGQLWMSSSVDGAIGRIDSAGRLENFHQKDRSVFSKTIGASQILMGFTAAPTTVKSFTAGGNEYALEIADTIQFNSVISHVLWNNYLFFSINRNVFRFDGSAVVSVLKSEYPVINLSVDRQNHLWVGFLNHGVTQFMDVDLKAGKPFQDLRSRSVTTVLQDTEGGYWFSTLDRGVYYFPNLFIKNYTFDQGSKVNSVTASDKTVYTGNYLGQIIAMDAISKEKRVIRNVEAAILTVHCDREGLIWVSCVNKTFIMDKTGKTVKQFTGLTRIKDFFEDNGGAIWAVNQDGIFKFDRKFNVVLEKRMDIWPRSIFVDGNSVYLGARVGMERFDTLLHQRVVLKDLASDKISGIIKLDKDLIAIGTSGSGLYLMNRNSLKAFRSEWFFPDNIYSMAQAGEFLWLSTEKGLIRLKIRDLITGSADYRSVSRSSLAGHKNNFLQMVGDTLFAFSEASFSVMPSDLPQFSNIEPQTLFRRLMVNDRPYPTDGYGQFRHFENNLKIVMEFIAFNNQDFQLRHRLNRKAWETGSGKELRLYSLGPGTYQLEVEYLADGQRWKRIIDYDFSIMPPWWETWYFRVAVFSALVLVVSLPFYGRIRSLKEKRLRELDIQHKIRLEKDRIAKDLHDNIGSQLTSLSLGLRDLERKANGDAPVLGLLRKDVRTMMVELRNTIWAINKEEVTLDEFSDKVKDLLWRIQQRSATPVCVINILTKREGIKLKPIQAINLFRITQEAIINSLNHSGADKLAVDVSYDSSQTLAISISDNGRGFDPARDSRNGHYGLENMKRRAQELHAPLIIDSGENKGTSVVIRLAFPNGG